MMYSVMRGGAADSGHDDENSDGRTMITKALLTLSLSISENLHGVSAKPSNEFYLQGLRRKKITAYMRTAAQFGERKSTTTQKATTTNVNITLDAGRLSKAFQKSKEVDPEGVQKSSPACSAMSAAADDVGVDIDVSSASVESSEFPPIYADSRLQV